MTLDKFNLILFILPTIILVIYFINNSDRKFFKWIHEHWFFQVSKLRRLSNILSILGLSLFLIALLDFRGEEEIITGKVTQQRTIMLIDSSASMLAEDVRPNRFKKAILLAKHYIRKAVGHQISVVVFSDMQKTIVPFTADVDLIESRLSNLETMDLIRGGSALRTSLQESIQNFKNNSNDAVGNILIFSDAEDTTDFSGLKIPDSISVAFIGVGTLSGSRIPLRRSNGDFAGYKKFQGEEVITKLNEEELKKLEKEIKHFKYWIATSYSIPTEEILEFFEQTHTAKMSDGDFRIKPVKAYLVLAPAMFLFFLSYFLRLFKPFQLILLLLFISGNDVKANSIEDRYEQKLRMNQLSYDDKLDYAEYLLKEKKHEEAITLYKENLKTEITRDNINDHLNFSSALINGKDNMKAIDKLKEIKEYLANNPDPELNKLASENLLKAISSSTSDQSQGGDGDSGENENENDESDSENQNGQNKNDKQDNKNDKQDENNGQEDKQENKNNKNDEKKDENKTEKDPKKDNTEKSSRQKVKELPAILKQIMSDDNQLQKKVIDSSTTKQKTREEKDW
jgi:Ca-activated chloride channel family protein